MELREIPGWPYVAFVPSPRVLEKSGCLRKKLLSKRVDMCRRTAIFRCETELRSRDGNSWPHFGRNRTRVVGLESWKS